MPVNIPATFDSASQLLSHFEAPSRTDARTATHAVYNLGRILAMPGAGGPAAAAARRAFAPEPLLNLLEALVSTPPNLAKSISQAAWGLGKLWTAAPAQVGTRCNAAILAALAAVSASASSGRVVGTLDAQAVAALLHAHGTVGAAPAAEAFRALQARAADLAPDFKPQDVANTLWALARLGAGADAGLLGALGTRLTARGELAQFKPMELSSTAWALAKLDPPPPSLPDLMLAVHAQLAQGGDGAAGPSALLRGLTAQGASNCLWAFSRAGPPPPPAVVEALLEQAARQAASLTPQGVANVCGAAARLGGRPDVPLRLLGAAGALDALGAADVAEAGWALGVTRLRLAAPSAPPHELEAFDARAAPVAASLWRRAAAVSTELNWQEAAHLAFAVRSLSADAARAATPLLAPLAAAALSSVEAAQAERGALDGAACAALLRSAPWASLALPRGAHALLAGAGSAAACCASIGATLSGAGLAVSYWNRFADASLPSACPAAAAWPSPPPGRPHYDAVFLRLPPSKAAFELAAHAAASVLAPGGALVLFGARAEGVHTARSQLPRALYEKARLLAPSSQPAPPAEGDGGGSGGVLASVIVAQRTRTAAATSSVAEWETGTEIQLPGAAPDEPPPPRAWTTMPGLFAGGGLDVMTTVLLGALPPPPPRARVLDFCCGSGTIGAALTARTPSAKVSMLDADAVALHAARLNVPSVKPGRALVSDCWASLPAKPKKGEAEGEGRCKQFDWIVSNPPVHNGLQVDFTVLRTLIDGAASRLRPGGKLWLVCQCYVPVGVLLDRALHLVGARAAFDDGRFTVWIASRPGKGEGNDGKGETAAARATACAAASVKVAREAQSVPPAPVQPEQREAAVAPPRLAPPVAGASGYRRADDGGASVDVATVERLLLEREAFRKRRDWESGDAVKKSLTALSVRIDDRERTWAYDPRLGAAAGAKGSGPAGKRSREEQTEGGGGCDFSLSKAQRKRLRRKEAK